MLSRELLKKIRRIHLKIARLSTDILSGHYTSSFKGTGIEFDEVREYVPGDDVRSIDWNVTARSGAPYVKRYAEERELTIILMVDLSGSQRFGTANALKSELAAEIAALFAYLAIKNNDQVGLLLFSGTCEKYLPPQKGRAHVLRVIREILGYCPRSAGTDLGQALDFIHRVTNKRSIVFLISDFLDAGYESSMRRLSKRHDLVAVRITDPRERELPSVGLVELEDNETGARILLDTSSPAVRERIINAAAERDASHARILSSCKIDAIEISTDRPYLEALRRFFAKRERKTR
ncbi:MAG: DUF58 domain-containing protein [Bacillota bacterium]